MEMAGIGFSLFAGWIIFKFMQLTFMYHAPTCLFPCNKSTIVGKQLLQVHEFIFSLFLSLLLFFQTIYVVLFNYFLSLKNV